MKMALSIYCATVLTGLAVGAALVIYFVLPPITWSGTHTAVRTEVGKVCFIPTLMR